MKRTAVAKTLQFIYCIQCTTQADRDVGYREWFKTVPAIYHEININR